MKPLAALWMMPVAVPIWALYIWPARLLGLLELHDFDGFVHVFWVRPHRRWWNGWWHWLWRLWLGHCLPFAVVSRTPEDERHMRHELHHHRQWEVFGPLYPPVYVALSLWFGYRRNPFEVAARAAEQ